MFTLIIKQCKVSFLLLLLMSILTGVIYPLIVAGIGQLIFPWQANGSLIKKNNIIVGSALIGQEFTDPQYFWGRPSATLPYPYNAQASSGSNLDPINDIFLNAVRARSVTLRQSDWSNPIAVPVDLVTASGSGLDPEISPFAAEYQVNRVAKARGLPAQQVQQLLDRYTHGRTLGLLGEPRVNVLQVNLALDALQQRT